MEDLWAEQQHQAARNYAISLKREREVVEVGKTIWRNNGQNLSKFDEATNLQIKKAHQSPSEETWRKPLQEAS